MNNDNDDNHFDDEIEGRKWIYMDSESLTFEFELFTNITVGDFYYVYYQKTSFMGLLLKIIKS